MENLNIGTRAWTQRAWELHSLTSIEISKQIQVLSDAWERKIEPFRRALNTIDALDILLESPKNIKKQPQEYLRIHHELLQQLVDLDIYGLVKKAIAEKFGENCYFSHIA